MLFQRPQRANLGHGYHLFDDCFKGFRESSNLGHDRIPEECGHDEDWVSLEEVERFKCPILGSC